jgi:hypothetical protein
MYTEINAAIQASKTALEIIKANKELLKYNELNVAVSEIYSKLNSSQITISALFDENQALKQQISEMREKYANDERFDREISRYTFHKLESGVLVYKIKPEHEAENLPTYICTECARDRKIVFMQPVLNGTRLMCDDSKCRKQICTGWKPGSHK